MTQSFWKRLTVSFKIKHNPCHIIQLSQVKQEQVHTEMCTQIFTGALTVIAKSRKPLRTFSKWLTDTVQ